LQLERRDYFPPNTPYQLPNIRQDWHSYNTDELSANIIIKFLADLNDKNSIDHRTSGGIPFYPGTILQATHEQQTVTNQKLVLLKGLREINLPVARGVAKDSLNFIEQLVKDLELLWQVFDVAYTVIIDAGILVLNIAIGIVIALITIWNIIMTLLTVIIDTINAIINIATIGLVDEILPFDGSNGMINTYPSFVPFQGFQQPASSDFDNRLNALLIENDILTVPKVVMIDTSRPEFIANRIGYLHSSNPSVVNTEYLWNNFYHIDAFIDASGNPNNKVNRFTKISPALNKSSEKNRCILSLNDFNNLVSNSKFLDQFGEEIIADSIQWFIEQNGAAEFNYRKLGWLKHPQHPDVIRRAEEIAINLKLKISIPNGQ
jgi:hypothetical protein